MEKEALISNLKAKVGENDFNVISERTLDGLLESFLPMFEDDTKVTEDTYILPVKVLKNYVGQYRHDIKDGITKGVAGNKASWEAEQKAAQEKALAEALAKAKEDWEKANQKSDGKNEEDGKRGEQPDFDKKIQDAITKALGGLTGEEGAIGKLSKQFGDYMAAQAAKEKAAVVAKTREDLKDFLIELGADESKPRVIELALNEIEIGDTPNMSDLQKTAKSKYESLFKDLYGDGGKPFAGSQGGGGNGNSTADFKAFIKMQEEKDKAQSEAADALKNYFQ